MQPLTTHLYTKTGYLPPTPPFDFAKSLNFLGSFAPMEDEQTLAASTLTKAVYVEGQIVAFQLTSVGSIEEPKLEYTLFSDQPISDSVKSRAVDRISFFLGLHDDLHPFYQLGSEDSDFSPIVQDLYSYHQVKFLTPFEVACWAVLVQRNPLNIAQRMKQALIEAYGGSVTVLGTTYWAFPEATRLIHVNESEFLSVVRNARKAEYLVAVIRAFSEVDEHFLRTADYDEVAAWLHSIRGFGEWSVSFVLLRGLGRMEQVPVSEKKLIAAASRLYGHGHDLTRAEVEKIAERYGSYKGYWAHYVRVGS
jgi:DNA-3-methyladenine glycosylase II